MAIPISGVLPLPDALAQALDFNLSLRASRLERDIADARVLGSYSEALPKVNLSGSYTRLDQELRVEREGVISAAKLRDRYRAEVILRQPLFTARMAPAIRTGKLYTKWAEMTIREAEEEVRYAVVEAYYRAVLSDHLLEVNLSSLETARRQLVDTHVRREHGMASNYDELRAEVEVSNFQAEVLQAKNNKDAALTALYRLLGVSAESDVTLSDALPLVIEDLSFDEALRVAFAHRPDIQQAEYALRLQQERLAMMKADYWPEVSAYVLQTWGKPDPQHAARNEWGDEWEAGIQVSMSLFDGFARRGNVHRERAILMQNELALRDLEEQTASEIRERVLALKTAEEFARSQSRNLDTAREALRLVETGLREGQNTPVEVMDARQALTTASANYYQSLYNHAMARVALQKATGLLSTGNLPDAEVLIDN